jgi:hypothetical protein
MSDNAAQPGTKSNPFAAQNFKVLPLARAIGNALVRRQCPRCDSDRIHRSHRRAFWERIVATVILPYRCEFCTLRFFRLKWGPASR